MFILHHSIPWISSFASFFLFLYVSFCLSVFRLLCCLYLVCFLPFLSNRWLNSFKGWRNIKPLLEWCMFAVFHWDSKPYAFCQSRVLKSKFHLMWIGCDFYRVISIKQTESDFLQEWARHCSYSLGHKQATFLAHMAELLSLDKVLGRHWVDMELRKSEGHQRKVKII